MEMESVNGAGGPSAGETAARKPAVRKEVAPPERVAGGVQRGGDPSQSANIANAEGPGKAFGGVGGAIDIKA